MPGPSETARLKRIDHVGIVVQDRAAVSTFLKELGFQLRREVDLPGRLQASFWGCGDAQLEIIEIIEPVERSRRLGDSQVRIEHIGVEVEDIGQAMEFIAGLGVRAKDPKPARIGSTLNAWTEPESSSGIAFQLMQKE